MKTKTTGLYKRSHYFLNSIYSLPGVIIRERGLIDRGLRRRGPEREPEDRGMEYKGMIILPSFSFNPKSRITGEFKRRIPIGRIYRNLHVSQTKKSAPRLSRKVLQIKNARSYLIVGMLIMGFCIILSFLFHYAVSILPLFFSYIFFLNGIRGYTRHNSDPHRLRDTFIIYCGCLISIIGIIFLFYASEAIYLCKFLICPVSPGMAAGIGIAMITLAAILIRFGIHRIRLKFLIDLVAKLKLKSRVS